MLTVKRPRGEVDTLQVVGPQTFRAHGLTYHFSRNTAGKAPGFAVDIGRARGMEFDRVTAPAKPASNDETVGATTNAENAGGASRRTLSTLSKKKSSAYSAAAQSAVCVSSGRGFGFLSISGNRQTPASRARYYAIVPGSEESL